MEAVLDVVAGTGVVLLLLAAASVDRRWARGLAVAAVAAAVYALHPIAVRQSRSLLLVGRTYGAWLSRLRFRAALRPLLDRLDGGNVEAVLRDADLPPEPRWTPAIGRLLDHGGSAAHREKVLADFEAGCESDLASARTMARLGPMLGLMGTLIPMGPALVGLAAGDIVTMAENLQVAFSTTVVGLFVGGIGFAVQQAKQRWHAEALNDLEFVSGLVGERAGQESAP